MILRTIDHYKYVRILTFRTTYKINIPSLQLTILMLKFLENTPKFRFDSYMIAVKFLT